jgi:hypothetical protein
MPQLTIKGTLAMLYLPISKLELARTNARQCVSDITDPKRKRGFSRSMLSVVGRHAINYLIHKNESKARIDLDIDLQQSFKTADGSRRPKLVERLQHYIEAVDSLSLSYFKGGSNLKYGIASDVVISGRVPAVMQDEKGGLVVAFFTKESYNWYEELKFPFIQQYVADNIGKVASHNCRVGVYNYSVNAFELRSFDATELSAAISEVNGIGKTISSLLLGRSS